MHPGVGVRLDTDGYLIDAAGATVPDIVCSARYARVRSGRPPRFPRSVPRRPLSRSCSPTTPATARCGPPRRRSLPGIDGCGCLYAEGVRRLLAVQDGASVAFAAAVAEDPHHARAHVALAMIATERPDRAGGPDAVSGHLARARAALAHGSDEDRSHVEAIATWCEKGNAAGTDALIEHLERYPTTRSPCLCSRLIASPGPATHCPTPGSTSSDSPACTARRRGTRACAPTAEPNRASGRRGRPGRRRPRTRSRQWQRRHALSHVHYETDAHGAGLKWLTDWIPSDGSTQRYLPHFQWHAALHELAMGDAAAAARRYAAFLAPPQSKDVRCLVDTGSLAGGPASPGLGDSAGPDAVLAGGGLACLLAADTVHRVSRVTCPGRGERPCRDPRDRCTRRDRRTGNDVAPHRRRPHRIDGGEPRAALDYLLESLPGLASIGGSRVQQEVVLETALAAMLSTRRARSGGPPVVAAPHRARPAGHPRRGELSCVPTVLDVLFRLG